MVANGEFLSDDDYDDGNDDDIDKNNKEDDHNDNHKDDHTYNHKVGYKDNHKDNNRTVSLLLSAQFERLNGLLYEGFFQWCKKQNSHFRLVLASLKLVPSLSPMKSLLKATLTRGN